MTAILKQILHFWKTILVVSGIFTLCLIPSSDLSKIDLFKFSYIDLVVHLIMFSTFSALLFYDLQKNLHQLQSTASISLLVLSLSMMLGIFTETLQWLWVSIHRTASLTDFAFDLIGALTGIALMRFIRR